MMFMITREKVIPASIRIAVAGFVSNFALTKVEFIC